MLALHIADIVVNLMLLGVFAVVAYDYYLTKKPLDLA